MDSSKFCRERRAGTGSTGDWRDVADSCQCTGSSGERRAKKWRGGGGARRWHTGHPRGQRARGGCQALGCGTMPPSRVPSHSGHKLLSTGAALKAEDWSHLVAPNSQWEGGVPAWNLWSQPVCWACTPGPHIAPSHQPSYTLPLRLLLHLREEGSQTEMEGKGRMERKQIILFQADS